MNHQPVMTSHDAASYATVVLPTATAETAPSQRTETVSVLHVINGEHYAGAERVQDLLAKRLPEFGFRVGFACVKSDAFDAMRMTRDAPLFEVPMRTRFDLSASFRIARLVRNGNYRLLNAHGVRAALVASVASRLTGVPMIYHVHSPATRETTRIWSNRFNGLVERLCLRQADRAIAVSQAMADHIISEGFDSRRVAVVPNGVPGLAALPERERPTGTWTLGMVALFRPRKGVETLIEAMALLRDRQVPVRLRAIGTFESPKYETEIAAMVHRLGLNERVAWTGFTRDVASQLSRTDLLVLPSLFGEGLPMVVLEAMAAGVPVVATHVSGVPEAIRHGHEGVLADPGNAESLAGAIADVVEGRYDWEELRRAAFERHAEMFSDRAMAAGTAAVYRAVLENRDARGAGCQPACGG